MDWPNPKTFWSSVASVMVRSTALGVSKITNGASSWSMQHFFHLRINPFPFGLVKVLRRWSTAAPKMSRRWDRDTILNQTGLQNGITEHIVMCMARFQWHVQNIISLCASFVSPFSGVGLLNLETRFKSSNFIFYDLWKNFENDEAIQSRLAEPDGFISKAVITDYNESPHISWSPQHSASAHFAALALDPLFVKD